MKTLKLAYFGKTEQSFLGKTGHIIGLRFLRKLNCLKICCYIRGMKKKIILISTLFLVLNVQNSYALPERKFKNCTELNKVYVGGVSEKKSSTNKNKAGVIQESKNAPKVSSKIYRDNKGLDRDKDGIACEN
jgi:hypothetical protein